MRECSDAAQGRLPEQTDVESLATYAFMGVAIVALFKRPRWSYILVNGGYLSVALTLMGLILGAAHR